MKGMLLKVVRLRLDHGHGRISQKPWLAHGGVSGPESRDEPSMEATSLQSLGAGMGGDVTSSNSLIRHPPSWQPFSKGHTDSSQSASPVQDGSGRHSLW